MGKVSNTRRKSRSDIVCLEGNGARPSHHGNGYKVSDDFETWKQSEVANTINTFDLGDTRSTTVVVDEKDETDSNADREAVLPMV